MSCASKSARTTTSRLPCCSTTIPISRSACSRSSSPPDRGELASGGEEREGEREPRRVGPTIKAGRVLYENPEHAPRHGIVLVQPIQGHTGRNQVRDDGAQWMDPVVYRRV